MKKHLFLLALLPILFGFASCSSDSTSSSSNGVSATAENYLPLKVGNYWIYENRTVDTSGAIGAVNNYDSVVVVSTGTYFGKSAYMTFTYNETTSSITDTNYYEIENNCVYMHYNGTGIANYAKVIGISVEPNLNWMKIADFNGLATWTTLDTTIANVPFTYPGIKSVDCAMKILDSSNGALSLTTDFSTYSTSQKFNATVKPIISLNIDTTVTYIVSIPVKGALNIENDMKTNMWFVANIGLVKKLADPSVATMTSTDIAGYLISILKSQLPANMTSQMATPGSQSVLVRYKKLN